MRAEPPTFGWDIGGAHVKACRLDAGRVGDAAQWPCALWQGLDRLDRVLAEALARWPEAATAPHAVTMSGEMVDLFEHREAGVAAIAARLADALPAAPLRLYAGDGGWCGAAEAADHWPDIASANWRATAVHAARVLGTGDGLLVDIGSTTTDIVALRDGRVLGTSRSDVERLATGELVYSGVARTPLAALAPRIAFRGRTLNVMKEFFATTADVYRLTGELDPAHDQHPAADGSAKDLPATRRRLARMIGLDARDAHDDDWLAFARAWRDVQLAECRAELARVVSHHHLAAAPHIVAAGCGAFLVPEIAPPQAPLRRYAEGIAPLAAHAGPALADWVQVCAPAVAVASLHEKDHR